MVNKDIHLDDYEKELQDYIDKGEYESVENLEEQKKYYADIARHSINQDIQKKYGDSAIADAIVKLKSITGKVFSEKEARSILYKTISTRMSLESLIYEAISQYVELKKIPENKITV
jgi:hypothetical protein